MIINKIHQKIKRNNKRNKKPNKQISNIKNSWINDSFNFFVYHKIVILNIEFNKNKKLNIKVNRIIY